MGRTHHTGQVLEETDTSGNMQRDYVFFAGRRIAWRDSSGNAYYYFADAIGSTRAVTNSSGTACFEADYYPYGQENDYTTSCSPTYKFTGYEFDSETGNYYAYARYYDPSIGRFLSADPLGGSISNPQSLNRYSYVLNNPESYVDPWGACGTNNYPCPPPPPDTGPQYECGWVYQGATVSTGGTTWNEGGYVWECGPVYADPGQTLYEGGSGSSGGGGGGGNTGGSSSNQTPPQSQGKNGCLVTVFDPSCKPKEPPSCLSVFVNGTLNAIANGGPVFPQGESPEDLVRAGGVAYAASYTMEHTLVVPLRSSVVRGILGVTEDISLAVAAYPAVEAEVEGLNQEVQDWSSGTCSTAWTK